MRDPPSPHRVLTSVINDCSPHRDTGQEARKKLNRPMKQEVLTRQLNNPSLPVSSAPKVMTGESATANSLLRGANAAAKQHEASYRSREAQDGWDDDHRAKNRDDRPPCCINSRRHDEIRAHAPSRCKCKRDDKRPDVKAQSH